MFYKEIKNRQLVNAYLEYLEGQVLKISCFGATMVAPSWVQCVCQSAQKSYGYITEV